MNVEKNKPWTVCRPSQGSQRRVINYHIIALHPTGQAGNLAIVLALAPCLEMIPAALLVAVAGGIT